MPEPTPPEVPAIPTQSQILPDSTGKLAHARVSEEHRGEREALFAHERYRGLAG